jgi:hypothetical protein
MPGVDVKNQPSFEIHRRDIQFQNRPDMIPGVSLGQRPLIKEIECQLDILHPVYSHAYAPGPFRFRCFRS